MNYDESDVPENHTMWMREICRQTELVRQQLTEDNKSIIELLNAIYKKL